MSNRKKPTNKEVIEEVKFLGSKLYEMHGNMKNVASIVDLYILFKKDDKKFAKFVDKKLIEAKTKLDSAPKEAV